MRKTVFAFCSKIDLDGVPSKYYPRFRPRRLVMPVNPDDIHNARRQKNQLFEKHKTQQRQQREATKRGALKLAAVPAERSVADAFRLMMDVCEREQLFHTGPGFTVSSSLSALQTCLDAVREATPVAPTDPVEQSGQEAPAAGASPFYAAVLDTRRDVTATEGQPSSDAPSVRRVDQMWALLERTPLNSPVHGVLAQRGKALTELYISELAYQAYPRLRSKHLQALLHETCGLLPCSRVATRLGFADVASVQTDIGLWRELNTLTTRFQEARQKATQHLQRVEKGVPTQRRWYWRGVLRSAVGRLKHFPAERADLQPRLEWIRSSVFAFIAFVEMAERSGDVEAKVRPLVGKVFCSQLTSFVQTAELLRTADASLAQARRCLVRATAHAESGQDTKLDEAVAALERELLRVRQRSDDEEAVLTGKSHPLNDRADRRREQFESTGGTHGTQALKDDLFDDYRAVKHAHQAPPMVLHATSSHNALKEIQLILKYAADVAPALHGASLDVDQVVRKVVEVHETNPYASLPNQQQYRSVEYTVCRLYASTYCIGEGKGETLMEAMQEAAQDAVYNYYLNSRARNHDDEEHTSDVSESDKATHHTSMTPSGSVRIREARAEEELAF